MKNKKSTLNSNVKKNKNSHKKKQKVSKSIAKKQFVSKHAANDSLANEFINLQKNNDDYSSFDQNNDNIQQDNISFIKSNIPTSETKNNKKDDKIESIVEDDTSYISDMFKANSEENSANDNMFSATIVEKEIVEVQELKPEEKIDSGLDLEDEISESFKETKVSEKKVLNNVLDETSEFTNIIQLSDLDDIKYKDVEVDKSNQKAEKTYKDISEDDLIQDLPKDTYSSDSFEDLTINTSRENVKEPSSEMDFTQEIDKNDLQKSLLEDPVEDLDAEKTISFKKEENNIEANEATVVVNRKDSLDINPYEETIIENKPIVSTSVKEPKEPEEIYEEYDDYDDYETQKGIIPYGFLRGSLFTILFISITLMLFTAPFIIAYIGLGILLVISSFAVAASAFVYLENYNEGIRTLISQVYPQLHEKFTNYSFVLGVAAIIIIIILFKLIYTLHSNYFSWSFRFLHKQFTGRTEYEDELEDIENIEESLEY